jgi:hypothetical protein
LPPGAAPPQGAQFTPPPFAAAPNVARSDLPALARMQLRQIRDESRAKSLVSAGAGKAHWEDIVARVDDVLDARKK